MMLRADELPAYIFIVFLQGRIAIRPYGIATNYGFFVWEARGKWREMQFGCRVSLPLCRIGTQPTIYKGIYFNTSVVQLSIFFLSVFSGNTVGES